MVDSVIHLYYWGGIRALAQPARYVLEYAKIPYEQHLYYNDDDWFVRDKPNLKMVLPNIPYIQDGDLRVSEHDAIVRYLAHKFKPELLGTTHEEYATSENVLTFLTKLYQTSVTLCYTAGVTNE